MKHLVYILILCTGLPCFAQMPARLLHGKVLEQGTLSPIAGARIYCRENKTAVFSRADGTFEIAAPTTIARAQDFYVQAIGYQGGSPSLSWKSDADSLVFLLQVSNIPLTNEVVVTANKTASDNFTLPKAVTVLEQQVFMERNIRSTPEALPGATSLWLQKTNHGGGSPFVRGLTGQQTLMMVDGIRLNNATFRSGPNQYLNTIDPAVIDRIEVVRGSGSVEYGSDAIGGVVDVQTTELPFNTGWHGSVDLRVASQDMEKSAAGTVRWSDAKTAFSIDGAYRDFGDLIGGKGIGIQRPSGYEQWAYQFKIKQIVGNKCVVSGLWQDLQQNKVPVFHKIKLENFALNQFDPQRRQFGYIRAEGRSDSRWWSQPRLTLSWQRLEEGRQSQKNGSNSTIRELDDTRTLGIHAQAGMRPRWSAWRILNGVELYRDKVYSSRSTQTGSAAPVAQRGLYPDNSRMYSVAVFSLHQFVFSKWTINAGLRASAFQLELEEETLGAVRIRPTALVGNFGLSYTLWSRGRLYANANNAFRTPNVDDLGTLGIVDFRYEVPNTDLRPERSRSVEIGYKHQGSAVSGTFSTYYTRLDELIGRIKTTDSIQGYVVYLKSNIGESYITGAEGELEWHLHKRWVAQANACYTYGQNVSAKEPFRRIPPVFGRFSLRWQANTRLSLRAESLWAGWQRRLAKADVDDNRIADTGTPGWQVLNLQGHWAGRRLQFSMEAQNLFNTAYRTHGSGIDGLGRSLWVRVRFRW